MCPASLKLLGDFLMGEEAEHKISEWESAWECVQSERAS